MLMTAESSRRDHLCPLVTDADSRCLGPMCPAWRWYDIARQQMFVPEGCEESARVEPSNKPNEVPDHWEWVVGGGDDGAPSGWLEPIEEAEARRLGYCGMAGPVVVP